MEVFLVVSFESIRRLGPSASSAFPSILNLKSGESSARGRTLSHGVGIELKRGVSRAASHLFICLTTPVSLSTVLGSIKCTIYLGNSHSLIVWKCIDLLAGRNSLLCV